MTIASGETLVARPRLGLGLSRALGLVLGTALVMVLTWRVVDFPVARLPIALLLAAYMGALLRWPRLWLIVLPAALPVFDLAVWSGRFFLTEFDFLVLATLAVIYGTGAAGRTLPGLFRHPYRVPALLAFSVIVSTALVLLPLPPVDGSSFASYLSPWNALRVAKGFFWAWLLLPALHGAFAADAEDARDRLAAGMVIGLGLAGIGILWERGVFADLVFARNIYGLLESLLDFSGTYRATGLFSGMHVGGEAIDGYLSLAAPFSLYPVLFARKLWVRAAGLAVFALGTYGVMVTFSRGLYAGYGIGLLGVGLLLVLRGGGGEARRLAPRILAGLVLLALITALFAVLYGRGGFEALAIAIALLCGSAILVRVAPRQFLLPALVLIVLAAVLAGFRIHGALLSSKWAANDAGTAFTLAVAAALVGSILPMAATRRLFAGASPFATATLLFLAALFWVGTIPPLSGYRAQARFATVERDLGTRQEHWARARAAMDPSLTAQVFGMGPGSFPKLFFSYMVNSNRSFPLATYEPVQEGGLSYLRLGGGDFNIIQRLPIEPGKTYRLEAKIRPESGRPIFAMKICHKHILYSERYVPDCRHKIRRFKKGEEDFVWQDFGGEIQSGKLGRAGPLYWPTTLMLFNGSGVVQVTDVKVIDENGRNLVANGDFSAGMDRWFLVSDFEHLAWHSKNLYLHLFIEQGGFGLGVFLIAVAVAAFRLVVAVRRGDRLAVVILPAILSFLAVGSFGTLLDMPRVATLFYLLLFTGLILGRLDRQPGRNPQARG